MKKLGLYLHIPFCRSKCLYCDFCSIPRPDPQETQRYAEVLRADLLRRAPDCTEYEVDTVYFGGGTPTVLPAESLARILETVFSHYRVAQNAEITAECNPATADRTALRRMRSAGFNRLSVGVQSAQERELRALGRIHSFAQVAETWEDAMAAGFSNLSADLMFGIPHQTEESFAQTLERVMELSPKHLSAYALTVEPNTPFGRRGEESLSLPDEEAVRRMYLHAVSYLAKNGICQYEISNFARRGYESRHNLKYWNTEEYLGFGPAAHSDFAGERIGNAADLAAYLSGKEIAETRERPTESERMNESIMLRLRLSAGISVSAFAERFGESEAKRLAEGLCRYVGSGLVRRTEDSFSLTPEGMLVSNAILSELVSFETTETGSPSLDFEKNTKSP